MLLDDNLTLTDDVTMGESALPALVNLQSCNGCAVMRRLRDRRSSVLLNNDSLDPISHRLGRFMCLNPMIHNILLRIGSTMFSADDGAILCFDSQVRLNPTSP